MALVVEDGTIVAGAEAYASVADADTYWSSRGNPSEWTVLTVSEKEVALRQATEYLESTYIFKSCLQDITQPLSFPRLPFYGREGRLLAGEGVIPTPIKNANIELALQHIIKNLFFSANEINQKRIKKERVVDHEIEYDLEQSSIRIISYVEKLLRPYILSSHSTTRIIRG